MANEACKKPASIAGIETEIEVEGFAVFVNLRDTRTGLAVQAKLHRRAAAALRALLGDCDGPAEDAGAMSVILRGELTTRGNDAKPPTVSATE